MTNFRFGSKRTDITQKMVIMLVSPKRQTEPLTGEGIDGLAYLKCRNDRSGTCDSVLLSTWSKLESFPFYADIVGTRSFVTMCFTNGL
jgi:hypothetical protein